MEGGADEFEEGLKFVLKPDRVVTGDAEISSEDYMVAASFSDHLVHAIEGDVPANSYPPISPVPARASSLYSSL